MDPLSIARALHSGLNLETHRPLADVLGNLIAECEGLREQRNRLYEFAMMDPVLTRDRKGESEDQR